MLIFGGGLLHRVQDRVKRRDENSRVRKRQRLELSGCIRAGGLRVQLGNISLSLWSTYTQVPPNLQHASGKGCVRVSRANSTELPRWVCIRWIWNISAHTSHHLWLHMLVSVLVGGRLMWERERKREMSYRMRRRQWEPRTSVCKNKLYEQWVKCESIDSPLRSLTWSAS